MALPNKTFLEELEEWDRERIAEINRTDTPERRARASAMYAAETRKQARNRRHTIRHERFIPLSNWGI